MLLFGPVNVCVRFPPNVLSNPTVIHFAIPTTNITESCALSSRSLSAPKNQRQNIRQDEYEKLKHSAQLVRNSNSTAMALLEEQNRHLSDRVRILENSHAEFTGTLSRDDEPVQRLLAERQLLEQRLEEAHLHLADIKSTWSAQNLALETQVSRLSHQVAAETTEKRKALTSQDDQVERIKRTEFELEKCRTELEQRDCKVSVAVVRFFFLAVGWFSNEYEMAPRSDF